MGELAIGKQLAGQKTMQGSKHSIRSIAASSGVQSILELWRIISGRDGRVLTLQANQSGSFLKRLQGLVAGRAKARARLWGPATSTWPMKTSKDNRCNPDWLSACATEVQMLMESHRILSGAWK